MRVLILWLLLMTAALAGCARRSADMGDPGPGIGIELAAERAGAIRHLRYDLSFSIPAAASEPIVGRATIRFDLKDPGRPLVLDFTPGADSLASVSVNGRASRFRLVPDHIVMPGEELKTGENRVEVAFRTAGASLNRNPEFMYTLFVPARAHLTFPCFDQPDLKGRFTLELTLPQDWVAVANGVEASRAVAGRQQRIRYAETLPLPTYLFAFAAGKFQVEAATRHGDAYRMFHRETDTGKLARNKEAVFDLHDSARAWLEDYTGIGYAFGKFDFVAIPSFQFSGMEHPGAIFYNASSILLDPSATQNQVLNRASIIAHETAHMWFGNLVTMRWFDDVWMKEVFANVMAAKIANPAFPEVNHELRFLVAHYPTAYSVDRTEGTHPIRQPLANLNEAGSLYGAIIYNKAPIVMRQLERILGSERLRDGLRAYLKQFQFGNASWLDLVTVLDRLTPRDLAAWSRAWVEEAGRPSVRTERNGRTVALVQADPRWTQRLEVLVGTAAAARSLPIELEGGRVEVPEVSGPEWVLPTGGGLGYGDFTLDPATRSHLLQHLMQLRDPVARGAAWVTLWEEVLDRRVQTLDFVELALRSLPSEDVEQNVQLVLGYVEEAFWRLLPQSGRQALAARLEQALRAGMERAPSQSFKSTYFAAIRSMATTAGGVAFVERVWSRREKIPGLTFAETDEAAMALDLAVRSVPGAEAILRQQHERFLNPDRKARFAFVMPALSGEPQVRDAFFKSLSDPKNRSHEPWVLEGLRYLNHPLRADKSEQYVRPSLELLQEIHRTGDIFFPLRWLEASLRGYSTRSAADTVRGFLAEQKDYPVRLHRIVLQAADPVFRAVEILDQPGKQ